VAGIYWLHDNRAHYKHHARMNGAELDFVLKQIGWSPPELARRLGVRNDSVYQWLTNRRPIPTNLERWLYQVRAGLASAPPLPEGWQRPRE
jgi:hypothetical protein